MSLVAGAKRPSVPNPWPDVASATDSYGARFAGPVGEFLLSVQTNEFIRQVKHLRPGSILDAIVMASTVYMLFLARKINPNIFR